jgi:hypothetical protein
VPTKKRAPEAISETTIELAAETLAGDVQSFLVDRLRQFDLPFQRMSAERQADEIERARSAAALLVRRACAIIAADGRETIPVTVIKVANDSKAIRIMLTADKHDELRHVLFDAAGDVGHLTVADPGRYMGGEAPAPEPDQRELDVVGAE